MLATRLIITARNSAGAISRGRSVFPHKATDNSHASLSSPLISTSNFSTSRYRLVTKPSPKDSSKDSSKPSEELPPMSFSFEGLGLSRNTKIVVLVIISIFGTIETVFWIRWIWQWFKGDKDNESSESKA